MPAPRTTEAQPLPEAEPAPTPEAPVERPRSLVAALAAIQGKMPVVGKGQTAKVPMKSGGSYSFDYSDLSDVAAAVYPLLSTVGLAFIASPAYTEQGKYMLTGELAHESGQSRTGQFLLPERGTPQEIGSAITYGRRYLLGCLTGITTGDQDDDGAAASRRRGTPAPAQQQNGQPSASEPQQPEGPPTAGQLRAKINAEGKRLNLTPSQIGDDFTSWSQGESIREATPAMLQKYIESKSVEAIA